MCDIKCELTIIIVILSLIIFKGFWREMMSQTCDLYGTAVVLQIPFARLIILAVLYCMLQKLTEMSFMLKAKGPLRREEYWPWNSFVGGQVDKGYQGILLDYKK